MKPPAFPSADHAFRFESTVGSTANIEPCRGTVIGPLARGRVRVGIKVDRRVGTAVTGNALPVRRLALFHLRNRRCRMEPFCFHLHSLLTGNFTIEMTSHKQYNRNIQSTPWSTKNGLAGKDVAELRITDLTRRDRLHRPIYDLAGKSLCGSEHEVPQHKCHVANFAISFWLYPASV